MQQAVEADYASEAAPESAYLLHCYFEAGFLTKSEMSSSRRSSKAAF
jgi:hypothetical protein